MIHRFLQALPKTFQMDPFQMQISEKLMALHCCLNCVLRFLGNRDRHLHSLVALENLDHQVPLYTESGKFKF